MTRTNLASLMVLVIGVPAAAAASFLSSGAREQPCFVAGHTAYRMATGAGGSADVTIRIDNAAARPALRMQVVDDPAAADFVLVDDGGMSCPNAGRVRSVRLDPAAPKADVTLALTRTSGDYKIYAKSAGFSEHDAAALFAAIWNDSRKTARR
ncbi:MAG: hypothetical protein ACK4UO_14700 [Pseudolabrys sp.]